MSEKFFDWLSEDFLWAYVIILVPAPLFALYSASNSFFNAVVQTLVSSDLLSAAICFIATAKALEKQDDKISKALNNIGLIVSMFVFSAMRLNPIVVPDVGDMVDVDRTASMILTYAMGSILFTCWAISAVYVVKRK